MNQKHSKPNLDALILNEIKKLGGNEEVIKRLKVYDERGLQRWVVKKMCFCTDTDYIVDTFTTFSALIEGELSHTQVRHMYYSECEKSLFELRKDYSFNYFLSVLEYDFPPRSMWEEILPYVYRPARNLAVELELFDANGDANETWFIAEQLGVSERTVCRVRANYKKRMVEEGGKVKQWPEK